MSISGAQVVTEALRWMGTPFHHQASVKGVGVDCIGLITGVADALGLPEAKRWREDTRFRNYGRLPLPDKLLAACTEYLDPLTLNEARLGDILLFTFLREPMHFGIISKEAPRYMIHAYEPIGRVVENVIDDKWKRRALRAFRLRGID